MLKKTLPLIFLSAFVLGACTNNTKDTVPRNDDRPLDQMEDRERDVTPRMEDDLEGGTDIDGVNPNNNGNGGVMNNDDGNRLDNQNDPLLDDGAEDNLNNR